MTFKKNTFLFNLYILFSIVSLSSKRLYTGLVQSFFRKGIYPVISKLIHAEKKSIQVAAYSLTNPEFTQDLLNAHSRGVKITIIVDQSTLGAQGSQAFQFTKYNIPVYFYSNKERSTSLMHNKFIIFESQNALLTGSYNFSKNANYNLENAVLIKNYKEIYQDYEKEFRYLLSESTQIFTKNSSATNQ